MNTLRGDFFELITGLFGSADAGDFVEIEREPAGQLYVSQIFYETFQLKKKFAPPTRKLKLSNYKRVSVFCVTLP